MRTGVVVGTFDMFHIGHLNLLKNARVHCDCLIAGVNTDAVVLRDKHKIPIINERDRLEIIRSIFCVSNAELCTNNAVDFIRWLLQKNIKIDFYFRGDEPTKDYIVAENEQIRALGVQVIQFPYTKDISSSELRTKLQK